MPAIRPTNPHVRQLRRNATDVEQRLWLALRNRRLDGFKFRRQATIGPYVADFLWVEQRLIVELDGGQHNVEVDRTRTAFIKARGYRILRFWNNDVLTNEEGVLSTIRATLDVVPDLSHSPSPNQHQVNSAPRCSGHAGGMTDLALPQAGEG